ncbi:MFS transporter [Actinomadura madurae]|uniref:MFS transporter n=1 Tax=Actinomadura madurae TaxID=1993 RepID=UPI0020D261AF|nr:MFS transporter [Actinomadura madurae]MCP9965656.1 MFS transporter [Actinomadura madurae]
MGSLIAFRVLQGLGAGIIDPLVLVLLARAAGPAGAGRVMGLMGLILSLGPVAGPIVGGIVLDALGWRWMFLINLPVGAVALLLARRVLAAEPRDPDAPRTPLDVTGLALLGPGFAAGVLALSRAVGQPAWQPLLPLTAAAVLLAAYAVHALRVRRTPPLIDVRLFARASFTASVTVMTLTGLGTFAALFMLPLYYQQAHGHGALAAGLLVTPVGLGGALAMPVAGRLSDRAGSRALAQGGAALALLGMLAFTRVTADARRGLDVPRRVRRRPRPRLRRGADDGRAVPDAAARARPAGQLGALHAEPARRLGGIAVVALIVQHAAGGPPAAGYHGVAWFGAAAAAVILAGTAALPGRPREAPAHRSGNAGVKDASRS